MSRSGIGKRVKRGCGYAVALHKGFAEGFGAFKLCGCLCGAKNAQARCAKHIYHASSQRRFGANYSERNSVVLRPLAQGGQVGNGQVFEALLIQRGAAVARRYIDLGNALGLREFPCQRVFAPARADDEDFHSGVCLCGLKICLKLRGFAAGKSNRVVLRLRLAGRRSCRICL